MAYIVMAAMRAHKQARDNFVCSMAAYAVVCMLLQIKDRHNGNIMIDRSGRVIHIDYGFFLSKRLNLDFEKAPFKLTAEFQQVMGGNSAPGYTKFKCLCVYCFLAAITI